jgi:3-oxoacyl-[acyl-carrier protein] reductase
MRLADKVAVVTGAGRGIGRAIATTFAAEGAAVVCLDRDAATAGDAAAALRATGARALACTADVGVEADVDAALGRTLAAFGRLDIMVCNAGVGFHRAFVDLRLDDWERVLRVNLTGTFLCAQRAARVMMEGGGGSIVVMGSTSGQRGAMARTAYGVSKAGVMQLTRIAAVELAPFGIRVNAIAPGPVRTPLSMSNHTAAQTQSYLDMIPMKRYGEMDEVARVALFLASEDAAYVTGHVLNVDGGMNEAGLMFDAAELRSYARRGAGEDPR